MAESVEERLKQEIDELVEIGQEIAAAAGSARSTLGQEWIIKTSSWVNRIGEVIRKVCPPDSKHMSGYETAVANNNFFVMHSNYHAHIGVMVGIITAIQHEFDKGLLVDIRRLLQADIFADLLEMGEYLLDEGYKDAAAVLIGGVLEDALRKLAESHSIPNETKGGRRLTIEPLNAECAKAEIYDKLVQKQITSWGDLRNKAAHAEYDEYDAAQVKMMLLFVQKFTSDYLGS